jgi:hypothetical protein
MDDTPLLSKLLRLLVIVATALCGNAAFARPDLTFDEAGQMSLRPLDTKALSRGGFSDTVASEIDEVFFISFVPDDAEVGCIAGDLSWVVAPMSDSEFQTRRTSFGAGSFACAALGSNASTGNLRS